MSLYCDETGYDIEYGTPLRASTRADVDFYSALSAEVIERIPDFVKTEVPCIPGVGGVDIHEATSTKNFNSAYTITDFRLGRYLYSIPQYALELYLPNHAKRYEKYVKEEPSIEQA